MSNPQDNYVSPPQTPFFKESEVNTDAESSDSNLTARHRATAPSSPIFSPPHKHPFSSASSISLIMSAESQSVNHSQDSSNIPSIPNLSDNNWSTWYSAMESYFLIKDLDAILDESETSPPFTDTKGLRVFEKRKKHLAGIIGFKLSNQIRELLITDLNRRNPILLWRDIKAHFASTKEINRGRVFSKLFSLSCSGADLSEFISSAKKTLNKLLAIGVQTDSEMIAHFLLHLIPPSFETFKDMVIHTAEVTDKALSVNAVINLLQQHMNDKKI